MTEQPLTRYQKDLVRDDKCPRCRGELDTGWECNDCGYDAQWIAAIIYDLPKPVPSDEAQGEP